ncbi:hypothetical protein L861_17440 [Litchfieldella anticariensis FP35 = DSM 16096]|uniref:Uncharacterized protein n=1 Tax=Litchfieldella anticariensis (strain DSM 16096 / CECT 5854 / CIP 108499 / LMG 22089 / FP35) TaxID=1121939 RepID=S2LF36_LITA3|nr:hypothetical protein L861_17440 [Halomonas anticariensis FP35 = DSM 16096]
MNDLFEVRMVLAVVAVVIAATMMFSWYWTDRHATSS